MKKAIRILTGVILLFAVTPEFIILSAAETKETVLKVMTFNVFYGGTRLGQPLSQTAKVIQEAKADIVGLQEAGRVSNQLAKLLGWKYVSHNGIISRYEIVEKIKGGIKVKLNSNQEVYIFNLHLKPTPYQPYQLLSIPYYNAPFIKTEAEAIGSAKKARGGQISAFLKQVRSLPKSNIPIFVTGDFNEPSHLDWTKATAKSGRHPIKVAYPTSLAMTKAGFSDTWRMAYPDEIKHPGYTWTPLTKSNDPKDHHDRIDFVYFKGKGVKVNKVEIVGEDNKNADIIVSPYPSDHRAVVATFTISKDIKIEKSSD